MSESLSPETVFQNALEILEVEERGSYLDEVCGENQTLRAQVECLLAAQFAASLGLADTLPDSVSQESLT